MAGPEDERHSSSSEATLTEPKGPDPLPKPPMSLLHEIALIAIICAAQLLTQAALTQVITPLHIIGDSFATTNSGHLSWYAASYSLTIGTFILIAGCLGDMFGPKRLFLIGFLWFGLWSLVAGLCVYSRREILFDLCRALQGVGPAMLLPNALAILGRTQRRGGSVAGAAFSGLLGQLAWWPWAFWGFAIACCGCAAVGYLVVPACPALGNGGRFDYEGAVTGVAGLVLFNVAWNQAPIVGWQTPYVYVLLILGVLFSAAFFFFERRAARPLVPLDALSGNVGLLLGCVGLGWASFGIWLFYLWQMWEVLRKLTPLNAAAQMVPDVFAGFCAAVTTGFLLGMLPTGYIMVIAMVAFCAGNVLLATMPVDQIYWTQTFLSLLITPWGVNLTFPTATVILSNFEPPEHQGIGASLVNTIVNYSISIGLGIAGTVEVHVNNGGKNPTDILKGYRGAWYSAIGLSGLGVLLSLYFALNESKSKSKRESKSRAKARKRTMQTHR